MENRPKILQKYSFHELAQKAGGYYPLITIMNLRMRELRESRQPLVETESTNLEEIVCEELLADKLTLNLSSEDSEDEEQE